MRISYMSLRIFNRNESSINFFEILKSNVLIGKIFNNYL